MSATSVQHPGFAPDGTPVELFARLAPGRGPELVHRLCRPGATVLELGCGAGRDTRRLAELGHPVVAVDQSAEMLRRVGAHRLVELVEADIETLDLGRPFDAVVLPSYLVNHPDPAVAAAHLATCRRHVGPGGLVLVQRYQPDWAATADDDESEDGGFSFRFLFRERRGERFTATAVYGHQGETWLQEIEGRVLHDDAFQALLAGSGLVFARWLDEWRTWALAHPLTGSSTTAATDEGAS